MIEMDWINGLVGGVLIGAASAIVLLFGRRIAGVSGILGGLLRLEMNQNTVFRVLFLGGLIVGPLLLAAPRGMPTITVTDGLPLLIIGGLLVGFGTRLGGGCTSGHGVCGMSRASGRSIVATATFMAFAALTVGLARHVVGAAS
jgi:uncharacterized membrane protein YedE/YeeE